MWFHSILAWRTGKIFLAILGVLTCTASALAGNGKVLPPWATPWGYSLWDMAVLTAVYNTGEADGLTEPLPRVPFHVLVADATLKPDTMLYLPVFYADDSGSPTTPPFPKDLSNQEEDSNYLLDMADEDTGADIESFFVQVDSNTPTNLDDEYVVGVRTALLPDGTPAGHHYIVSAAFITPLKPGKHTVGIGGISTASLVVFVFHIPLP